MKFHKEITTGGKVDPCLQFTVYEHTAAMRLYAGRRYTARELSGMKQENIRVIIKATELNSLRGCKDVIKATELNSLRGCKDVIRKLCGYCFRYHACRKTCPISKKLGKTCYELPEWHEMEEAGSLADFADAHKRWCKELGLWQKGWE